MSSAIEQPSVYLPHGGGPCFFMEWNPPDAWDELRHHLERIHTSLPARPDAIVVVSAHWEEPEVVITSGPSPELIYDYYGFPPHTYELTYPAPGDPALAQKAAGLLEAAGHPTRLSDERDGGADRSFAGMAMGAPVAGFNLGTTAGPEMLDR